MKDRNKEYRILSEMASALGSYQFIWPNKQTTIILAWVEGKWKIVEWLKEAVTEG